MQEYMCILPESIRQLKQPVHGIPSPEVDYINRKKGENFKILFENLRALGYYAWPFLKHIFTTSSHFYSLKKLRKMLNTFKDR